MTEGERHSRMVNVGIRTCVRCTGSVNDGVNGRDCMSGEDKIDGWLSYRSSGRWSW